MFAIVFRPFKGEILTGKIANSSDLGIRISLDFFDDIFIPAPTMIFEPSTFNDTEEAWIWESTPDSQLFFDKNEAVKFRVEAETWTDLSPEKQPAPGEEVEIYRRSPYEITVSIYDYEMFFPSRRFTDPKTGFHAADWLGSGSLVGRS